MSSSGAFGAHVDQARTTASTAGPDQCLDARGDRHGDGVEPQRRDDAELAPAGAAESPEQIRLVVGIALDDAAVREDDLRAEEAIAGEPVAAPEQTDATAEREPGDADGGPAAGRQGQPEGVQRCVHAAEASPGPDRRDPVVGHRDVVEAGQVEHDPVRGRPAGEVVPTAARCDALARPRHVPQNAYDVPHRPAPNHEPRTDMSVRDIDQPADRLVASRVGDEHLPLERSEFSRDGHAFDARAGNLAALERIAQV